MPVVIHRHPAASPERSLQIGLINNMPDAALASTERQFLDLLRSAAGAIPVCLRLFCMPDLPRSEVARQHLAGSYAELDELWGARLDGLIVTGTEPRSAALVDEPYWEAFTRVLEWAQTNTASSIWSCLAAHAAVLHMDGIARSPLEEKRVGIFGCDIAAAHGLLADVSAPIRVAHSRWNELAEEALADSGYSILTRSPRAGVDAFVKQRKSLLVFFQGHPEYDDRALLREYRRDVARFLRTERDDYPSMPLAYFDPVARNVLNAFRELAIAERDQKLLDRFPFELLEQRLHRPSRAAAVRIYANWLAYLNARRERSSRIPPRTMHAAQTA